VISTPARGQVSPDGTLPTNVTQSDNYVLEITGGVEAGSNLFHSFREFSVPTSREVFFNNSENITNIISRVTGGSISNIDGLIRANGSANLLLLNPAGIIFGSHASLNIGGSFLASTARSLLFSDGTEFSATNTQTQPLLTINTPIGLQFGDAGSIVNRSVGLQVQPGQTLALVGGDVKLEGGNLTAPGGRIELGGVSGSLVSLTPSDRGWVLGYQDEANRDIVLSNALVDTSGLDGGTIHIRSQRLILTDATQVFSINFGAAAGKITVITADSVALRGANTNIFTATAGTGSAGDIRIETKKLSLSGGASIGSLAGDGGASGKVEAIASEAIELVGTEENVSPSAIGVQVPPGATGNGKDVTIATGQLIIRDGAQILANTGGSGRAGNLTITASDIKIFNTSPDGIYGSAISTQAEQGSTGNGGNLTINAQRLTARNGGFVSASTFGSGRGGNLTVNVLDSINLSGTTPTADLIRGSSGLFVLADEGSSGNGGELNLKTRQLVVEQGAKISVETFGTGDAGNSTLDVNRLTVRDGGQIRASSLLGNHTSNNQRGRGGTLTVNAADVEIIGIGTIGSTPVKSSLFTQAEGTGNAGDLNISTTNLTVRDGGEINVSATGTGEAGNLTVEANSLRLEQGTLNAATASGEGGNINLKIADSLLLRNNSLISAQASGDANGGNIDIDTKLVIAAFDQNNDIIASALRGEGGNINITTQSIFGLEERSATPPNSTNDIDASSEFGLDGNVAINVPEVEPNPEVGLPNLLVNVEVAQGCQPATQASLEFFHTGRGGIAPNPDEPLSGSHLWEDVPLDKGNTATPSQIVESQGWIVDDKGAVTLVAALPSSDQVSCR